MGITASLTGIIRRQVGMKVRELKQKGDDMRKIHIVAPQAAWGATCGAQNRITKKASARDSAPCYPGRWWHEFVLVHPGLAIRADIAKLANQVNKITMQQAQQMQQQLQTEFNNLERQVGQVASTQNARPNGALPSDTEKNPVEKVQAINLRSGKALKEMPPKKFVSKEVFERLVPQPEVEAEKKDDKHRQEIEYLRDIVANKRRLTEFETTALTEECSARVQSKLPPKLKDPGCFTIPLAIGKHEVGRALCDLGASTNLMPLSVFKQLDLGAPMPTTITLQLADRSLVVLEGIIEDVLVRVGKFILPANFNIPDYMADEEVPIILGRPFLSTGGALIDVREGKLNMRVHDEEITFNVYKALNLPKHYEDLCMISMIESKLIK
uniref:Aspartic peptidase DDI1-type domain-containing protein n=1 Tax=Nicotiana tabacum TaxID=4097 RepID=A0A1S3YRT2_TOBAC|nr:PREDICTED: uncharacterized protein LOC107778843 [Nicotiana tabacum]